MANLPLKHFSPSPGLCSGSARSKERRSETLRMTFTLFSHQAGQTLRATETPWGESRALQVWDKANSEHFPLSLDSQWRQNTTTLDHQKELNNVLDFPKTMKNLVRQRTHQQLFWWVQCKWIRNRWIKFPFKYTCARELALRNCLDLCISRDWVNPKQSGMFCWVPNAGFFSCP